MCVEQGQGGFVVLLPDLAQKQCGHAESAEELGNCSEAGITQAVLCTDLAAENKADPFLSWKVLGL